MFERDGNLSLSADPKENWAGRHPESFPVRLCTADRDTLLRVPGIGPLTARRILDARRSGASWRIESIGLRGKRLDQVRRHAVME